MRLPSRDFGTVVILSTIKRHGARKPFASSGATRRRNSGASVGSVVKAATVIEAVPLSRSSCTMTTGRGFPAVPLAEAVQISPRFTGDYRLSSEIASMKPWSARARLLLATASDCRRAFAAKLGDRTSGTQIWTGRNPSARSRTRCARTLSREVLGLAWGNGVVLTGYM